MGGFPRPSSIEVVPIIETSQLRRTYRINSGMVRRRVREVEAVRGVTFSVDRAELYGLLVPNGVGKTTTIKMLISLLIPTSGKGCTLRSRKSPSSRGARLVGT